MLKINLHIYVESDILFEKLLGNIEEYNSNFDRELLVHAYNFAKNYFGEKKRRYGDLFIEHALYTALNVSRLEVNDLIVSCAILHDILRLDGSKKDIIEKEFGIEIADILDHVSKIPTIKKLSAHENVDSEQLKVFLAGALSDIRVIFIKISEVLHNLDCLDCLDEDQRVLMANEIIDVYAPVAEMLSLGEFKVEIENKCFKYVNKESYSVLHERIGNKIDSYNKKIEEIKEKIENKISEYGLEATVFGRVKSIYSIYKKMKNKNISFNNISDILAIRIVTKTIEDAYFVLGIVHSIFKVRFDRFKDYISLPKQNGYQAIHTTCFYEDGDFVEFQIQTEEMLRLNRYGIASHFLYKNSDFKSKEISENIKNILLIKEKHSGGNLFLEKLKNEILKSDIICYTPEGKGVALPKDSTLLDFAFKIGEDYGYFFEGAFVNNEFTDNPIFTLNDGDLVDLMKGKNKYINFRVDYITEIKTNSAYEGILDIFRKGSIEDRGRLGKFLLSKRLEFVGFGNFEDLSYSLRALVLNHYGVSSVDDFYIKIGEGVIRTLNVVEFLSGTYYLNKSSKKIELKIYLKIMDFKTRLSIVELFYNLNTKLYSFSIKKEYYYLLFYVDDVNHLNHLLSEIKRLPNVGDVDIVYPKRLILFYILLLIVFFIILGSLFMLMNRSEYTLSIFVINAPIILAFILLVFLLYFLKYILKSTLCDFFNPRLLWISLIIINSALLGLILFKSIIIKSYMNYSMLLFLSFLIYVLIIFKHSSYSIKIKDHKIKFDK